MPSPELQSHQIVFLECEGKRLYAEVIQTVVDRSLCWARPLALLAPTWELDQTWGNEAQFSPTHSSTLWTEIPFDLLDLRQASDLLLPLSWFQVAVDTEVIPVLAHLSRSKSEVSPSPEASLSLFDPDAIRPSMQEQLRQFVWALCQTYQP